MGSGIKPCKPASKPFEGELPSLYVQQLRSVISSSPRAEGFRSFARDQPPLHRRNKDQSQPNSTLELAASLRLKALVILVEFHHAVALRIFDPIGKNARPLVRELARRKRVRQSVSVKNIIAEN